MTRLSLILIASLASTPALAAAPDEGEVHDAGVTEVDPAVDPADLEALERALADDARVPSTAPPPTAPTGLAAVLQTMNPDMSIIFDGALSYFSSEPLQVGAHDPNRTGFTFQQLEMYLAASVDPFFRFQTNLVFSQFGVEVEEAYGTTLGLPGGLQIRAGQFLTRFGRLNSTHPHSWSFVDQPLVNGKFFGGEASRGMGLEVSILLPLPWYVEAVVSGTEPHGASTARSFYGADDLGISGVEDVLYTAAVKQFFPLSDDWSLMWGVSSQFGPNATGSGNRSAIYGTDLHLRFRPLDYAGRTSVTLTTELMARSRQVPDGVLQDWGMYTQLVWLIDKEWEVGARHDYTRGADGDYLDADQDGDRHRAALALTHFPSHFSRLRLQGAVDLPSWRDAPIFALILNVEFLIGAHGAHTY